MANSNVTRYAEVAQKKGGSVLVVPVTDAMFEEAGVAKTSQNFLVANLPSNSVITNAFVYVQKAADSATTATVQLGTAEGGAQLLAATDIKTTGVAGELVGKAATGSGQAIYARVAIVGATTTVGAAHVVLEYIEYTKNNGEYTQFS